MIHKDLIRTMLLGIFSYQYTSGLELQGNADYYGKIVLMTGAPESDTDFSKRASYQGYADVSHAFASPRKWTYVDEAPYFIKSHSDFVFPAATADSAEVITDWACVYLKADATTDVIAFSGKLAEPLVVTNGMAPLFLAGSLIFTLGEAYD